MERHNEHAIIQYAKKNTLKQTAKKYDISEDEVRRLCVLDMVKHGQSMKQAAKKYNIWVSTVSYWCKLAGIQSKHTRAPVKADDKQILAVIKKNKVLTVVELEKIFGYHTNAARRRLKRLVDQGKLNYVVIGGGGKSAYLFRDFIDKRLYYLSETDLHIWIKQKMPKHIPSALKNAISQKLHDVGIDIEFKTTKKKAILVPPKTYQHIKENATRDGVTIAEYVKKVSN